MEGEISSEFLDLLTSHQTRLFGYIVSLLGNAESAWDVLQETNRVLIEKRAAFESGTSFVNWSLTVAQFQTRAWLRDKGRDRHVVTSEIVELMAQEGCVATWKAWDGRLSALETCMARLTDKNREMLKMRYVQEETILEISKNSSRSVNNLKQLFFRLRKSLAECIKSQMELQ